MDATRKAPSKGGGGWTLRPRSGRSMLSFKDRLFEVACVSLSSVIVLLIAWIGVRLFLDSSLTRGRFGTSFLTKGVWDVPHELYGASTFVFGTLLSSTLALVIAVPLSVGAAIYLTEFAPRWLASPVAFLIDLLAAVPSIVYGLWGFFVLCPFLQLHASPWLGKHFGNSPLFAGTPVLTNMLAAGVILAIMVTPIITAVSREVVRSVPSALREASMGLGATRWETMRRVVLPEARSGITGAVILGLGRAIGETMAVVMVIGNTPQIKASLLQPGYTMPALLANTFNEAFNDNLQRSALLEIALVLFVVTLLVNAAARMLLNLTKQHIAGKRQGASRVAELVRKGMDFAGRYSFLAVVTALVGLQLFSDLKARGAAGLVGGFELALACALVVAGVARAVGGSSTKRRWRRALDLAVRCAFALCAFTACFLFVVVLGYVATQGFKGLNLELFTQLPRPAGVEGGGLKSAILGTLELVAIAGAIGIPVGLLAGVFVSEFNRNRLGPVVRFCADVLNGIPSVVIGLFAYAAFVLPFGHFSAWAGGAALAVMMVPIVARTTEEIVKLVPQSYREAAAGLGATKVQTILTVVIPAAKNGIVSGVMLAVARVAGETAPLIFTAFGSDQLATNPNQPVSSLTMKIYQYAGSPYDDWVRQAWAGALVLLLIVLLFSVIARIATRPAQYAR